MSYDPVPLGTGWDFAMLTRYLAYHEAHFLVPTRCFNRDIGSIDAPEFMPSGCCFGYLPLDGRQQIGLDYARREMP